MDHKNGHGNIIYLLTFISFLLGILQFVFSGILDQVAASIGVSVSVAGQLITSFSLGSAIGTPIVVLLTAKVNKKAVSLSALIAVWVSVMITIFAKNFSMMLLARIILGVGFGVYTVSAYSIIAEISETGRLARSMANLAIGASAALIIGVPAARLIADDYDWRVIFIGIGVLMLLVILILAKTLPRTDGEKPIPLREQLIQLKHPKILIAFCVTIFMFISYASVNTYIAPFMLEVLSMSSKGISIVLVLLGIVSLVGAKSGGHLSDIFSPRKMLSIGMLAQTICLLLILVLPMSQWVTVPLLLLWALSAWVSGPLLNVNLVTVAPSAASILLSLNSSFVQLGFAIGAITGGIAVDTMGVSSIVIVGAIGVIIATGLGVYSFRTSTV